MTAPTASPPYGGAARRPGPRSTRRRGPAGWYARLRATHPVRVLRWLRTGVLVLVAATALLYLTVSVQAGQELRAARRTEQAVADVNLAVTAAGNANAALIDAFAGGNVALIGTGTEFANATAEVYNHVTTAAAGNAAGRRGLAEIQFVQGQLTNCVQLAEISAGDFARDRGDREVAAAYDALNALQEVDPDTGASIPDTGGLISSLRDLANLETAARDAQLRSHWLDPAWSWSLLTGPAALMLLLVLATGWVLARHFRRHVDPLLLGALLATAAVGAAVAVLGGVDVHRQAGDPRAGHPLTMTLALCLLAAAGVCAYLAYRPRLAEYRFPPT
ncbi:hypothetical protein V2S66_24340 [Streptomyces sp. V4-01]|uniref:Integral membrane protein n=1 Tax=Actinacidiphila polyblastidii TaxID=3110430 RepID=A0ABU7PGX9_9ACTN|nr:hypothetical protein [Streptomyces sp. V4-01]